MLIRNAAPGVFLAVALLLGSAAPASADGSVGLGLSTLSDEGGTGFLVDYSKNYKTVNSDQSLGWVVEGSFFHNGFGNDFSGVDGSLNTLFLQGGVRWSGIASEKVMWFGQGLVGFRRSSINVEAAGLTADVCEAFDIDCSVGDSDSGGVLTVGGGLQYNFNSTKGVRGQLDFPIALGDGGSATRFSILFVIRN